LQRIEYDIAYRVAAEERRVANLAGTASRLHEMAAEQVDTSPTLQPMLQNAGAAHSAITGSLGTALVAGLPVEYVTHIHTCVPCECLTGRDAHPPPACFCRDTPPAAALGNLQDTLQRPGNPFKNGCLPLSYSHRQSS
jgi:hypothetical protein